MRVLYCYIQFLNKEGKPTSYHGMDNIELNLATTANYGYSVETNVFQCKERKASLSADFWADQSAELSNQNIYNISVIAGENGSGKTTAIRCVMNLLEYFHYAACLAMDKPYEEYTKDIDLNRALLLLEEDKKTYLLNYVPQNWLEGNPIVPEMDEKLRKQLYLFTFRGLEEFTARKDKKWGKIAKSLLKTKVIYMTNTLTQYDFERSVEQHGERRRDFFIYDVSMGSIIGRDVGEFFSYEIYKEVKYAFDRKQIEKRKNIPEFTLPHFFRLRLRVSQYQQFFLPYFFPTIGIKKDPTGENSIISSSGLDLAILLGMLCICTFAENIGLNMNEVLFPLLPDYPIVKPNDDSDIFQELRNIIWTLEKHYTEKKESQTEEQKKIHINVPALKRACKDYLDFLEGKRDTLFSHFTRLDENSNVFELSLDAVIGTENKDEKEKESETYNDLIDFMEKYRYTCEPAYTIDFDWGLSSGEENLLRIFSNLYHIFDRDYNIKKNGDYKIYNNESHARDDTMKTECDTVLFFLDEADLTFHPEWQRRLIAILTTFVPQIYPYSCVKDIQLILTTHSPLLLGDIPRDNIKYLFSKQKHEDYKDSHLPDPGQTFGQNIHTLLKDSFFLSKGTVGAFAAGKINDAAKRMAEIKEWAQNIKTEVVSDLGELEKKRQNYNDELERIRHIIDLVAPGVLHTKLEILYRETRIKMEEEKDARRSKEPFHTRAEKLIQEYYNLPDDERLFIQKTLNSGDA